MILRRCLHTQSIESLCNKYRQAMGGVASSANIITTNHDSEPRGLTISSLTSLSISPTPLVSFNLQLPSRTSQVLHDRQAFAINVLPPSLESQHLCRAFAGALGRNVNPFEKFNQAFRYENEHSALPDLHDTSSIPTVKFANSVIYCKAYDILRVQDHEIWVAQVYHVDQWDSSQPSILYQNRAFHLLGKQIE